MRAILYLFRRNIETGEQMRERLRKQMRRDYYKYSKTTWINRIDDDHFKHIVIMLIPFVSLLSLVIYFLIGKH